MTQPPDRSIARSVDVIVIGAGVNGLVAGGWLARRGRSVLIIDQCAAPGGQAASSEFHPGFRAPAGCQTVGPVSPAVIRDLRLAEAGLALEPATPSVTTIGLDGSAVSFSTDVARTSASLSAVSRKDADAWPGFVGTLRRIGAVSSHLADQPAPPVDRLSARDLLQLLDLGRRGRGLDRHDLARLLRWLPMAVGDLASETFEHDLPRAAVAAHALFGNPAGPRSAGTGAMLLQRVAADPLPVGSRDLEPGAAGTLVALLARLATDAGVSMHLDTRVTAIEVENGVASGVTLSDGTTLSARAVLSTADPKQTFLDLIPVDALPPSFRARIHHLRARGVTARVKLALAGRPTFPALARDDTALRGHLLFAPSLEYLERAHDVAKYGGVPEAPWLDARLLTAVDSSLAPEGSHVMTIDVHFAPHTLRASSWADETDGLFQTTMRTLEALSPDTGRLVLGREVLTPVDFERRWGLSGGHIFHGETAMDQAWLARPLLGWARHETPVDRLFIGGSGTHPGVMLAGAAGLLAARAVDGALRA